VTASLAKHSENVLALGTVHKSITEAGPTEIYHHSELHTLVLKQASLSIHISVNVWTKYSRRWKALSLSHVAIRHPDGGRTADQGKHNTSDSVRQRQTSHITYMSTNCRIDNGIIEAHDSPDLQRLT
jgi:hypothetical protein